MSETKARRRSEIWFNDPAEPGETAVYLERYPSWGLTRGEMQSGKPIIGIAQSGSELTPCNRIHLALAARVKDGIRDAGGIPFEFPMHPIQESCRRPTAALDRNLAYLGLVEVMLGYPFDGIVLTTACDKTTPACLMAAATVNMPAIILSGGPMIDSYTPDGRLAGSGMVLWEARREFAAGRISADTMIDAGISSAPSPGHCNSMGTALSMNSLAEGLGMSLPGCAAIPAPNGERARFAYETGRRIVAMVEEDLTPSRIMTRAAFENAIVLNTAIGGSTNCAPHITAIARHMGVPLDIDDWEMGYDIPLLANVQPAGEYLGEGFHRAGGVPAVMSELLRAGKVHGDALTVTGRTMAENCAEARIRDERVIRRYEDPMKPQAGFMVLRGNLFDSALIKTSVISPDFRKRFLSDEECFTARVVVFDGPEDYRARIEDPALGIDENCMLVVRGTGPVGYPGSAEVVNMTPPGELVRRGFRMLPCMGDGRQSGTSDSPSILHASPESAAGGNLAILETGDRVKVDLRHRRVDLLVSDEEITKRKAALPEAAIASDSPWQQLYRAHVGQLDTGGCLEFAVGYRDLRKVVPRHSH
jgi:dihydroxy-acid dehydratase